uniref:Uncharacterized protein n=1 Tax=Branchiostoma floridae TaxID=7739 RepID=C3ZB26_BRAFL|eukprot:XP_002594052.1 hypothetical protein BRAFLDRAFT_68508 [Branchiostoma floridae]
MAEGPVSELQQTQTANSPTAAELTDPGGSTREGNGYMPMASIVNNGYTPMASLVDTGYTPMSPIVDNGYTPMASLQKASEVPPPLPPKKNRRRQGGPSHPSGDTPREPPRLSGETSGGLPRPSGETPSQFLLPKRRNAKRAGVYWMREEDIVNLPLNPMYNADLDLPEGPDGSDHGQQTTPKEVGGPSQPEMTASDGPPADGQAVSGPATHTYEDGDAFGMRLGPPLKGDPRSAPPVPSTPRPGRTTDGAQPVAAATHVYEDGESFGMRLGPALNRDAPAVPSTPRPGRPTSGAQQVPGGPNPLSNPQDVINQLQPNPMYNSNQAPQAPGSAEASRTICGRLRRRLSRRPLMYTVMSLSLAFVTVVTLAIVVPVLLMHFNRQPGIHGSPTTITAGPNTAGSTATAGPKTTDSAAWEGSVVLMGTDKVTSADVIKVTRHGHLKANFDLPDTVPRGGVRGMAVGLCNNHVYVTWSDGHSRGGVQAFTPDGKLLWNAGQRMVKPMYVAVDGKGNIVVTDRDTNFIYMYDETGRYVMKFGGPGLSGGRLNRPEGICVDSSGHIIVVDALNKRVVMYTGRGEYVRHIALRAESTPMGIAVGPGGQLVVAHTRTITVLPRY